MNTGPQGARYGGAARPISSTHMASSAFKNQTEHESPSNPFMKRGREGIFFKDQVPFFFLFFKGLNTTSSLGQTGVYLAEFVPIVSANSFNDKPIT